MTAALTLPADPLRSLLGLLDGVQRSGSGHRARCPACGGKSRKLSIAEADDRVLIHCFGGCEPRAVLQAVGLDWSDVMPARHWPATPDERRRAARAVRESAWGAALETLAIEGRVTLIAARQLSRGEPLADDDVTRLSAAVQRIEHAAAVMAGGCCDGWH